MNLDSKGSVDRDIVEASTVEKRCSTSLPPRVVDALLHGLGHDDEFRALFARDPRAALATLGHETATQIRGVVGADPVMCLIRVEKLASKEAFRAAADKLRTRMHVFFPFEYVD